MSECRNYDVDSGIHFVIGRTRKTDFVAEALFIRFLRPSRNDGLEEKR